MTNFTMYDILDALKETKISKIKIEQVVNILKMFKDEYKVLKKEVERNRKENKNV